MEKKTMDSLIMSIRGFKTKDIKGASALKGITNGADGDAAVAVNSVEFEISRNVTLDVGNGNNSDTGELTGGILVVTKPVDGLTPAINTILFKPKKGRCIDFTYGTPTTDGTGLNVQQVITIDGAKIIDYKVSTSGNDANGKVPVEQITISYTAIVSKFQPSKIDGTFGDVTADMVSYDFSKGVLEAGTKIGK